MKQNPWTTRSLIIIHPKEKSRDSSNSIRLEWWTRGRQKPGRIMTIITLIITRCTSAVPYSPTAGNPATIQSRSSGASGNEGTPPPRGGPDVGPSQVGRHHLASAVLSRRRTGARAVRHCVPFKPFSFSSMVCTLYRAVPRLVRYLHGDDLYVV